MLEVLQHQRLLHVLDGNLRQGLILPQPGVGARAAAVAQHVTLDEESPQGGQESVHLLSRARRIVIVDVKTPQELQADLAIVTCETCDKAVLRFAHFLECFLGSPLHRRVQTHISCFASQHHCDGPQQAHIATPRRDKTLEPRLHERQVPQDALQAGRLGTNRLQLSLACLELVLPDVGGHELFQDNVALAKEAVVLPREDVRVVQKGRGNSSG